MEHELVLEFESIDYVLVKVKGCTPWVAAWGYNKESRSWGQGHYFTTLEGAILYIAELLRKNEQ